MKPTRNLLLLLLLLAFAGTANAQTKPAATVQEPQDGQMKTYYMAFLKKGPNRSHDSLTAANIQAAHMAHINKMAADGKLTMAGPFLDDGDLRGIFIFNVKTMEEAKALTEADPAVKAGRLIMELHPWFSQKGAKLQ
ncbi:YciI family protein [Rufibacter soli]